MYTLSLHDALPILGGIMTGADALEFLIAGASAVEVGTANFVDPDAAIRIVGEIADWCEARGVRRVRDVVGTVKAWKEVRPERGRAPVRKRRRVT
jgi:dihydroorotate dehydrogenase